MAFLENLNKVLDYIIYYLFFVLAAAYLAFGSAMVARALNDVSALTVVLGSLKMFIVFTAIAETVALIAKLILMVEDVE